METRHRVVVGDARSLDLADDSVELVVTSPPYPMVEMWDDAFAAQSEAAGDALAAGDGWAAYEAMHDLLDDAWAELSRVLVEGGIACVVVGDATRSVDGRFRAYPNHARVLDGLRAAGFDPLPEVLWRKPTNAATKFMGSGMVPPNAYVTLEHEHVLVARNGQRRSFPAGADRRYEAAYFWEERNRWFSDVWTDVTGADQPLDVAGDDDGDGAGYGGDVRDRSGAFPFAVPYRLINMYSAYGDAVLDPFVGTGTTTLAAAVAGRDSVGVERDPGLRDAAVERLGAVDLPARSRRVVETRLADHRAFVAETDADLAYEADNYDLPVRTRQERPIRFRVVEAVERVEDGFVARHAPYAP
jgi:site-specific DNA-methyltransferase (cytosine-N4-specific)